jgi:hypothetical protein
LAAAAAVGAGADVGAAGGELQAASNAETIGRPSPSR